MLLKEYGVTLFPSSNHCRWNSMMASLRRMIHQPAWSAITTLLAQARIEASSVPPPLTVKREQAQDVLSLLQPFEEVMQ
ncbi:hypothetical protein LDENG_00297920, partial [Lucifuga dentata]